MSGQAPVPGRAADGPDVHALAMKVQEAWDRQFTHAVSTPIDYRMAVIAVETAVEAARISVAEEWQPYVDRLREVITELLDSTGLDDGERARFLTMAGIDETGPVSQVHASDGEENDDE